MGKGIMTFRTGIGFDVHRLEEGRRLVLGGVEIPHSKGLSGHSDADVLLHAISDALLGAAGEGDLGKHFPDSDQQFRGISSLRLLESVHELITKQGYSIVNMDAVLIAQEPRLSPYISQMRTILSKALSLDGNAVNIKVKSNEGLGALGRAEGIAAQAVTLLMKEGPGA